MLLLRRSGFLYDLLGNTYYRHMLLCYSQPLNGYFDRNASMVSRIVLLCWYAPLAFSNCFVGFDSDWVGLTFLDLVGSAGDLVDCQIPVDTLDLGLGSISQIGPIVDDYFAPETSEHLNGSQHT
jgi:hypothetical protein